MLLLYMFVGIAIVCDEYFVSSLELISDYFKISDDVAGATFMAAGGSAPEFATNLFGTLIFTSDVGFGTIVGSAVFNILFVIGLCAYFSGFPTLQLTWYPLLRDSSFYILSLVVLVLCVRDLEVQWYDALILIFLYILYVVIMKFDEKIKAFAIGFEARHVHLSGRVGGAKVVPEASPSPASAPPMSPQSQQAMDRWQRLGQVKACELSALSSQGDGTAAAEGGLTTKQSKEQLMNKWDDTIDAVQNSGDASGTSSRNPHHIRPIEQSQFKRRQGGAPKLRSRVSLAELAREHSINEQIRKSKQEAEKKAEEEAGGDDDDGPTQQLPEIPEGIVPKIKFAINAPLLYAFALTIPDCRLEKFKSKFGITFTMSIVWVAILSYFMVWAAEEIGVTIGLTTSVMGVTILAAGTSIPDAISSVLVAREGHGDMALSSSIGSNVFDITFGLPVPWLIYTGMYKAGQTVEINSKSLPIQVCTLIFMVVVVVVTIHLFHWKISKPMGIAWFILYFAFLAEAVLLETEVIKV